MAIFAINPTVDPDLPWGAPNWGGPFRRNGALFSVAYTTDNGFVVLRKSLDDGITWEEMTPCPDSGSVSYWFDELRTENIIPFLFRSSLFIRNYDLDTDTWSDSYGGAGPTAVSGRGLSITRQSNGDVVLIHMTATTPSAPFTNNLYYSVCPDGGSWSSIDNALDNPPGLSQAIHSSCVDDDDRVHVLYTDGTNTSAPFVSRGVYINFLVGELPSPITYLSWVPTSSGTSIIKALVDGKLYAMQSGATVTISGAGIVLHTGSEWETPTWSDDTIYDYGLGDRQPGQPGDVAFVAGVLTVVWSTRNADDSGQVVLAQFIGGNWTEPMDWVDPSIQPPDPSLDLQPEGGDPFYTFVNTQIGEIDGGIGVITSFFVERISDPSDNGIIGFYILISINIAGPGPASLGDGASVNFA